MTFNTGQIIFLVVAFAAGILLGSIITWLVSGRDKGDEKAEQEIMRRLRAQYEEIASLWHSRDSGKLVIRIDEQMLENPQQLTSPQRNRVQTLTKEWAAWLGYAGSKPTAQAAPQPAARPVVPPSSSAPTGSAVLVTPPPRATPPPHPVTPITHTAPPPAVPAGAVVEAAKPKSIVEQINDILQEKLAISSLHNKGIRLEENPRDGVVVWVGLERFLGVDTIKDPEVKAVVKAAAAEWEQRSGGSRI